MDENNINAGFAFLYITCLLYTSDAADERSSVDLGGRRIIKKKKNIETEASRAMLNTKYDETDICRYVKVTQN